MLRINNCWQIPNEGVVNFIGRCDFFSQCRSCDCTPKLIVLFVFMGMNMNTWFATNLSGHRY